MKPAEVHKMEQMLRREIAGVTHRRQRIRRTIETMTGSVMLLWAVLLITVDWSFYEIYQSPSLSTMWSLAPFWLWEIGLVIAGGGLIVSAVAGKVSQPLVIARIVLNCLAALLLMAMAMAAVLPPVSGSAPTLIVFAIAQIYAMLRSGL